MKKEKYAYCLKDLYQTDAKTPSFIKDKMYEYYILPSGKLVIINEESRHHEVGRINKKDNYGSWWKFFDFTERTVKIKRLLKNS